jgi:hypothetical protein
MSNKYVGKERRREGKETSDKLQRLQRGAG